jgi:hypothetical protein
MSVCKSDIGFVALADMRTNEEARTEIEEKEKPGQEN